MPLSETSDAGPTGGPLAGRLLVGRYRLNRPIASGGMAEVWEATDETLARRVAVKLLHPHLGRDDSFVRRFRAEAVAAARLAHPSIVSVYDTFSADGMEAIVMELVVGTTMRADLDQHGPMRLEAVLAIGTQVADALLRAARAVRLLGAQVVLTGIRAEVAQTLVTLGVDLVGIVTRSTLQAGIVYALQQTGSAQDILSAKALQAARSGMEWSLYQAQRNATCIAASGFSPGGNLADFTVSKMSRPLQGPKKVLAGEAKCALVDDAVLAEISKMDGGSSLKTVWTGAKLPPMVVVAFPAASSSLRDGFKRSLSSICEGDGQKACGEIGIQSLSSVEESTYAQVLAAYKNGK